MYPETTLGYCLDCQACPTTLTDEGCCPECGALWETPLLRALAQHDVRILPAHLLATMAPIRRARDDEKEAAS